MSIEEKTREFTASFKASDVYLNYIKCKKNLEERPELFERVNDFRRDTFTIQCRGTYGDYSNYEKISQLRKDNDDLFGNPIVQDFMDAELKLSKAISTIYDTFSEEVEFDTEFLLL